MLELSKALHDEISRLSAEGDALAEKNEFESAISKYNEAWTLVPEPKNDWEASTWLLTAIGDACFFSGHFTSGKEAFNYALSCPNGFGNPFIHLRLGQCLYETSSLVESVDHLTRAHGLAGAEIFGDDSGHYFEFLKTKILPPPSGWQKI